MPTLYVLPLGRAINREKTIRSASSTLSASLPPGGGDPVAPAPASSSSSASWRALGGGGKNNATLSCSGIFLD